MYAPYQPVGMSAAYEDAGIVSHVLEGSQEHPLVLVHLIVKEIGENGQDLHEQDRSEHDFEILFVLLDCSQWWLCFDSVAIVQRRRRHPSASWQRSSWHWTFSCATMPTAGMDISTSIRRTTYESR